MTMWVVVERNEKVWNDVQLHTAYILVVVLVYNCYLSQKMFISCTENIGKKENPEGTMGAITMNKSRKRVKVEDPEGSIDATTMNKSRKRIKVEDPDFQGPSNLALKGRQRKARKAKKK